MAETFHPLGRWPALKALNERDLRWLWVRMTRIGLKLPEQSATLPSEQSQCIANALNSANLSDDVTLDELVQVLVRNHKDFVIDEAHFDWLAKDNNRPIIWMLSQLTSPQTQPRILPASPMPTIHKGLSWREVVMLTIDCMEIASAEKIDLLSRKKREWTLARTKNKQTKWLDPKNAAQLHWAWEYLNKRHMAINIAPPVTPDDYYEFVLASLDGLFYMHPAEKTLFIEGMKKTWSQKKYRDSGKAKKQKYMPLTKDSMDKLQFLAKKRELKDHDLVEELIKREYALVKSEQL